VTYGVSTIQTFTEALQTNLQARIDAAEGANVVVVYDGWPTPEGWNAPDWIMLGDVEPNGDPSDGAVLNVTKQPRNEPFVLAVLFSCARKTRAQQIVNRRAFTLLDYLNQELRGNPRQGVSGVQWALLDGAPRIAKGATDTTRECHLEVGVRVRARI
jgi:hypothetical protein